MSKNLKLASYLAYTPGKRASLAAMQDVIPQQRAARFHRKPTK